MADVNVGIAAGSVLIGVAHKQAARVSAALGHRYERKQNDAAGILRRDENEEPGRVDAIVRHQDGSSKARATISGLREPELLVQIVFPRGVDRSVRPGGNVDSDGWSAGRNGAATQPTAKPVSRVQDVGRVVVAVVIVADIYAAFKRA